MPELLRRLIELIQRQTLPVSINPEEVSINPEEITFEPREHLQTGWVGHLVRRLTVSGEHVHTNMHRSHRTPDNHHSPAVRSPAATNDVAGVPVSAAGNVVPAVDIHPAGSTS